MIAFLFISRISRCCCRNICHYQDQRIRCNRRVGLYFSPYIFCSNLQLTVLGSLSIGLPVHAGLRITPPPTSFWVRGTEQISMREDSAQMCNPLPFYKPFLTKKVPTPFVMLSIDNYLAQNGLFLFTAVKALSF